jgi:glycosyltransferase involved in cell wall biosynthesis
MIIGLMHIRNEADIIEETVNYYHSQGVNLIVLDDGSSDSTFEICQTLLAEERILELHKTEVEGQGLGFRNPRLNSFQNPFVTSRCSRDNLMITEACAHARKYHPEWILVSDADAFLEARDGSRLSDALRSAQENGYDVIEFFKLNFFPSKLDDRTAQSVREMIKHYVALPAAPLDWSRHCARFEEQMYIGKHHVDYRDTQLSISPQPWIYRHYPLRSYEHACRKLEATHDYRYGTRGEEWRHLIESEEEFYRISPLMVKRVEGGPWILRYDIFQPEKLRSTKSHNAHEYLRGVWPTFPK